MSSRLMSASSGKRPARALTALAAVAAVLAAVLLPGGAAADQASQPTSPEAGFIATGNFHSCAVLSGAVRCWGYGGDGALGYGNTDSIGDDETPDAVGPVDLGGGRTAVAISAGSVHTCALLDNGTVRCWGFGGNGRLGYGNTNSIVDPRAAGSVNLGPGRTAKAIAAGNGHTCAILNDDTVRCWGFNLDGRLGYGHVDSIGDDENETPGAAGPVNLGAGRTAKAIATGGFHTCALLDDGTVRCWGFGGNGRLGYGNTLDVGRGCVTGTDGVCRPSPDALSPANVGPVDLGTGRTATAITAGLGHTCAVLDDGNVRCWGFAGDGRLGYGNLDSVGDTELPGTYGPVDLGAGRTATAIDAGAEHTCAVLDDGSVRCWGYSGFGQLGYSDTKAIGDDEPPASVGPVNIGSGRTATAISAGLEHTCARLDDGSVRCWGRGSTGRLGYCNEITIGDEKPPASAGPVALGQPGIPGAPCPVLPVSPPPDVSPPPAAPPALSTPPATPPLPAVAQAASPTPPAPGPLAAVLAAERARAARLQSCLRGAKRQLDADRRRARLFTRSRSRIALRAAQRRAARRRAACVRREGRTPGRVTGLTATAIGSGKVRLSFRVPGTDGSKAPAARRYVVKQSVRPIRTARDFNRAPTLCRGTCSFDVTSIDATATLTVTNLRRNRLYHYAVAALDNVSSRMGPRSRALTIRAR